MKVSTINFGYEKAPERKRKGDAGYDLYALEDAIIEPHETMALSLGIGFEIPDGYALMTVDRSSGFLKGLLASTALTDPNYRGEIHALLANITDKPIIIHKGDRPCSAIIIKVETAEFEDTDKPTVTERGDARFGSSGD